MNSQRKEMILSLLWRTLKVLPVVGYVFILAGAPAVLRRKGYLLGSCAIILDILPVVCLIKAAIEVYHGDIIPDRFTSDSFDLGGTPGTPAVI